MACDIPCDLVLGAFAHDEPVFATDFLQHFGPVIDLVVASAVMAARRAARQVSCDIMPRSARPFADVVKPAYTHRIQLWSDGFYRIPEIHDDKTKLTGRPFHDFSYSLACAEVAIDTLTGKSRVLRMEILEEVGTSIHPATNIGQIDGGFVQGMGWLTTKQR